MDYEGKYFPDEDENENKGKKKKILKYSFYIIVAVVYAVAFSVLFTNCEPAMYKSFLFTADTVLAYENAPDDFVLYEIHPRIFMNYDGSVQFDGVAYTPTTNELELGIKYNNKKLVIDDKAPTFTLVDTNGNRYESCINAKESEGRYSYIRISFLDVRLNLNDNYYINPEIKDKVEGEGAEYDTLKFSLEIVYPDALEKEPEIIDIFNGNTPIEPTEFKR